MFDLYFNFSKSGQMKIRRVAVHDSGQRRLFLKYENKKNKYTSKVGYSKIYE